MILLGIGASSSRRPCAGSSIAVGVPSFGVHGRTPIPKAPNLLSRGFTSGLRGCLTKTPQPSLTAAPARPSDGRQAKAGWRTRREARSRHRGNVGPVAENCNALPEFSEELHVRWVHGASRRRLVNRQGSGNFSLGQAERETRPGPDELRRQLRGLEQDLRKSHQSYRLAAIVRTNQHVHPWIALQLHLVERSDILQRQR
jgi:hypothetical protein